MAKSELEQPRNGSRKRQLNLIYFVDAARTRTVTIPLGRLRVLLAVVLSILAWSMASIACIAWLSNDMDALKARLRAAQTTIFEYETRYGGVYDIAYPPGGKPPKAVAKNEFKPAAADAPAPAPAEPSEAESEPAATAIAAAPKAEKDKASAAGPQGLGIVVSNPELEAASKSLELRFDLTNKRSPERVEGYIWAIAAFKTTTGETIYIGAPDGIQVKADGEPTFPQRATIFGIRHFKKKVFTFPFVPGKQGTFIGIRIGVMDRSGNEKTTYNVPVDIKVGGDAPADAGDAPKAG